MIGPNGLHQMLVTEVTGPTTDFLMESSYDLTTEFIFELPPGLMRRFARQLILVLKFLASEDVIHGGDGPARRPLPPTPSLPYPFLRL